MVNVELGAPVVSSATTGIPILASVSMEDVR